MALSISLLFTLISILIFLSFGGYGPDSAINFSGYIGVHNNERHLFYWFFESRNDPSSEPFIIWLTGGPGCSSLLALMVENGPYYIESNLSLEINDYSWNSKANVMWIDQPAGTGYSYDDKGDPGVYNEDEIAEDLYEFLQSFFKQNPKYSKLDFYVTGESYAGHYVPSVSHYIWQQNKNLKSDNIYINLKGFAIGDGLVDPLLQYSKYAPYAKDNNLVSDVVYDIMELFLPLCETEIYYCNQNDSLEYIACIDAYDTCNLAEVEPVTITGINPYDIREQCEYKPLCYNFDDVTDFFNENSTITALGAEKSWESCNRMVEMKLVFAGDWMKDFNQDIPPMLEDGIRALIYHGEDDFICNWYGGYNWVKNLNWTYQEEWNKAANLSWIVDNEIAGYNISYKGLTFLKVLNAGHMVPMDQPLNALAMIQQFTIQGGF